MPNQDPIPSADHSFDTTQEILVNAVTANAVAWGIPATEITKLTDKQTIWTPAWDIAKDKLNSTRAQITAKDLARKNYEKVLRPFIQKWVYRNELMDDEAIEMCGLMPRDLEPTPQLIPDIPANIKVTRGETAGVLQSTCATAARAESYGCIVVAGQPLPVVMSLNVLGQLTVVEEGPAPEPPAEPTLPTGAIVLMIDLNKNRKKQFNGLLPGIIYYFYYYATNRAGVSQLSAPVSMKCW